MTGSDEAGSQSKNDARVYYITWFCYISLRQLRPSKEMASQTDGARFMAAALS
jgi:hypothetical protein